jgi:hypothetical protein
MKKLFTLFFILLSVGTLSAQNLNFKDTNGLKTLLCGYAWIRYDVNPDSSVSDKIMDSIMFYPNGNYFKSARPIDDTADDWFPTRKTTGTWRLGSTGKISKGDTSTNFIILVLEWKASDIAYKVEDFVFINGNRIKGTKFGKKNGISDKPFLLMTSIQTGIDWDRRQIWQPRRQIKKAKPK